MLQCLGFKAVACEGCPPACQEMSAARLVAHEPSQQMSLLRVCCFCIPAVKLLAFVHLACYSPRMPYMGFWSLNEEHFLVALTC